MTIVLKKTRFNRENEAHTIEILKPLENGDILVIVGYGIEVFMPKEEEKHE